MRMLMIAGAVSIAGGGGAYLNGAFETGEYYEQAPIEVATSLARMQLLQDVGTSANGQQKLGLKVVEGTSEKVSWKMHMSGRNFADVTAHLARSGEGTRVSLDFAFTGDAATFGMADDEFINEVAKIAMTEKIDSTLEGRPYNSDVVGQKMGAYIAANPGALIEMQKNMQENAIASIHGPTMSDAEIKQTLEDADAGWGSDTGF